MHPIRTSLLLLLFTAASALTVLGIEMSVGPKVVGRWVFTYQDQQRTYEFKSDKTFEGSYPVSGKHFGGTWKSEGATITLVRSRGSQTTNFGIVTLTSDNEAQYLAEGYSMTGRKVELPKAAAPASPTASPADEDEPAASNDNPSAPGESSDEEHMGGAVPLGEQNVKEVFPKLELPTDAQGHPVSQSVRLNEKVIEQNGRRYSGFWFVVDRTEAAQKQRFDGWKGKMALYLYFLPPRAMDTWGIDKVQGEIGGGWSFRSLKLWRFKQGLRNAPPKDKDRIIVQTMPSRKLKEGKEYYMQFGFPLEDKEPTDMTICLGYRKPIWDYNQWKGFDEALDFLGLEHNGRVNRADMFPRK